MATDLTIRESIAQAFFANPERVRHRIRRWAKCRDADVDVDGEVWIADPQSGHWLGADDLARPLAFHGHLIEFRPAPAGCVWQRLAL